MPCTSAAVQQEVGRLRHAAVLAEGNNEVGPRAVEHHAVIGEDRHPAERGRPLAGDGGVGVLQPHQLDVRHLGQQPQIGGVVQRVPVADADGRDPDRRHFLSFTSS
jgi:hypothetical protein